VGPLVGELVGPLVGPLVGELVGPLVGELVGPLVGRLFGELVAANILCAPVFTDCTAALAAFEKKSEPSEDSALVPRRLLMVFVTNADAVVLL
jgi:hypothetical protein